MTVYVVLVFLGYAEDQSITVKTFSTKEKAEWFVRYETARLEGLRLVWQTAREALELWDEEHPAAEWESREGYRNKLLGRMGIDSEQKVSEAEQASLGSGCRVQETLVED